MIFPFTKITKSITKITTIIWNLTGPKHHQDSHVLPVNSCFRIRGIMTTKSNLQEYLPSITTLNHKKSIESHHMSVNYQQIAIFVVIFTANVNVPPQKSFSVIINVVITNVVIVPWRCCTLVLFSLMLNVQCSYFLCGCKKSNFVAKTVKIVIVWRGVCI